MLKSNHKAKTFRALMLLACGVVALFALLSCSTQKDENSGEEEMTRGLVAGSVDLGATGESIYVETNESGAYDVVITENNLTGNAELAKSEIKIVSDEEMGTAETAENSTWSLAGVKQEDVSVAYSVPTLPEDGEEPVLEMREAEVTGFSNDNGEIVLSFKAEESGPLLSWTYTVNFDGT